MNEFNNMVIQNAKKESNHRSPRKFEDEKILKKNVSSTNTEDRNDEIDLIREIKFKPKTSSGKRSVIKG